MSAQGHPLVFNEQQVNPHTTWQAASAPKTSLYTGTAKDFSLTPDTIPHSQLIIPYFP